MTITDAELKELGAAWLTIGDFVPVRREGEVIPGADSEHGQFSVGWWRGPILYFRKGDRIVEIGNHAYATGSGQRMGAYAEAAEAL